MVANVLLKSFLKYRSGDLTTDVPSLTIREVLTLLAVGLMGRQLGICLKIVAGYRDNITHKLNLPPHGTSPLCHPRSLNQPFTKHSVLLNEEDRVPFWVA